MSDAASDSLREDMGFDRERKIYFEIMEREKPRRERVLMTLLKFLRHKKPANRREFCEACKELNDFDGQAFLRQLQERNRQTWASLLHETNCRPRFHRGFQNLSPFSKKKFTFGFDGQEDMELRMHEELKGDTYTFSINFVPLFKKPKECSLHQWRYFREEFH